MPVLHSFKWIPGSRGVALLGFAALAYAQPFRPLVVVGSSMAPTYANGEIAVTVPAQGKVSRGDVVVVQRPDGAIVKRVALVPGDPILQVRGLHGWRNAFGMGHAGAMKNDRLRYGKVPEGYVYVLGDNLPGSTDSRQFGPVSLSEVTRKVYQPRKGGPGPDFVAIKDVPSRRTW
ncbi:MAG: signal peptidase I [Fimbriimonas sp.]